MTLDLGKTELLHFSRKQNDDNPPVNVRFPEEEQTTVVQPTPVDGKLRWLGVHFDRKMSFKRHVKAVTAKAQAAIKALRVLGGCAHGAPAHVLRAATLAWGL